MTYWAQVFINTVLDAKQQSEFTTNLRSLSEYSGPGPRNDAHIVFHSSPLLLDGVFPIQSRAITDQIESKIVLSERSPRAQFHRHSCVAKRAIHRRALARVYAARKPGPAA